MRGRWSAAVVAGAALAASLVVGPARAAAPAATVTVTGTIRVVVADDARQHGREVALLRSRHGMWQLDATARLPQSGTTVRVTGVAHGRRLAVTRFAPVAAAAAVVTTGTQSVYVIRAEWGGQDTTTAGDVTTAFGKASDWYAEVSYGIVPGLTTGVGSAWRHITAPSDCGQTATDAIWANAVAAERAATGNVFDPADYQHVVVYFPQTVLCSFAGLATVGGQEVWLNGDLTERVTTHELGHNLGLHHSHSMACNGPSSTVVTISTTCDFPDDYGDEADTMGGGTLGLAPHFSASQKARLGWLSGHLADVGPCTSRTLSPYEVQPTTGDLGVRVDAGVGPDGPAAAYWLEWRQPTAGTVETTMPTGPLPAGLTDGALLHRTATTSPDTGPSLLDGQPATAYDFTDAVVPYGDSIVTPEGYTLAVGTPSSGELPITLTTDRPSTPRAVHATTTATGASLSWQAPACEDGGVTAYDVTVDGGGPTTTAATSLALAASRSTEHTFTVTARNGAGAANSSSAVVAPTSAPVVTGFDPAYYGSSGGRLTFLPSISSGGQVIIGYHVVAVPVGSGVTRENYYLYGQSSGLAVDVLMTAGTTYNVTLAPVFEDVSEGPATFAGTVTGGDGTAPTPSIKAPMSTTTLAANASVQWQATDTGGAGVKSYDVRYRKATASSALGSYVTLLAKTTATSASVPMAAGSTYCFSVRARDGNGNLSGYSSERCTSRPLDDRALSGSWSRLTGSAYYSGTLSSATARGATLTRTHVRAKHLSLLVTKCATCGKVTVLAGTTTVTLDLHASSTHNKVLVVVPLAARLNDVTVRLKVASSGKPVKLDGLVVRAV